MRVFFYEKKIVNSFVFTTEVKFSLLFSITSGVFAVNGIILKEKAILMTDNCERTGNLKVL